MLIAVVVAGGVLLLVVTVEVYTRLALGLGNPPLWMADPEIEYLQRPSRSYRRFGNVISYNAYSMRSRDFAPTKEDENELRVLVAGDSIVNGGAVVDQDALSTTLIEKRLASELKRPVVVGNISAGSWGPPNVLAYFERFGLFDADVVIIVLNSPDFADAPLFRPLGPHMPQRRPALALSELWGKYLRQYLNPSDSDHGREVDPADVELCLGALRTIIEKAREAGAAVLIAQYLKRSELETEPERGHAEIGAAARELGIEPIQLGPPFAAALEAGRDPFLGDGYHASVEGQRVIADALFGPVVEAVTARGR